MARSTAACAASPGFSLARAATSNPRTRLASKESAPVHSFANRRYPGFRSVVPCGPGSSGAFDGKRTIAPFGRGLREASGAGAGAAGGGDSIALTGSGVDSIAASGASDRRRGLDSRRGRRRRGWLRRAQPLVGRSPGKSVQHARGRDGRPMIGDHAVGNPCPIARGAGGADSAIREPRPSAPSASSISAISRHARAPSAARSAGIAAQQRRQRRPRRREIVRLQRGAGDRQLALDVERRDPRQRPRAGQRRSLGESPGRKRR